MLMQVNEYLLARKDDDRDNNILPFSENFNGDDTSEEDTNKGTLTLDVTCVPEISVIPRIFQS